MRALKALPVVPIWFLVVAQEPVPSPSPSPVPTPLNASLSLDVAAGGPSTRITVTGTAFNPNQSMNLYWDSPDHVATAVTADSKGSFTKPGVTPFPGDKPGTHRLCASVLPKPCANFSLQGRPTPTPPSTPTPTPEASPSPSPSPSPSASPFALVQPNYGLDIITRPPFVFFPIIAGLGILGALALWALAGRRPPPNLPTASVVHRSARPDMGPITRPPSPPPPAPPEQAPPEPPQAQEPPPTPQEPDEWRGWQ